MTKMVDEGIQSSIKLTYKLPRIPKQMVQRNPYSKIRVHMFLKR